uniref:Uncharacterized protein n=1 Tax=Candidatus Kentrum sp. LFY TaxID=2126342 RepID=A0A450U6V3_9GAMM|nr:MAG: hypothetical protein BECKLFY1418A_GA0070994_1001101 [Candidatus Kentron sp. LFY]
MIMSDKLDKRSFSFQVAVKGLLDFGANNPDLRLFQAVFDKDVDALHAARMARMSISRITN